MTFWSQLIFIISTQKHNLDKKATFKIQILEH